MKKLLLIAIFIIANCTVSAQTSLNPKRIDGYNFSSTFIDKDYLNNNFLRGCNIQQIKKVNKLPCSLSIN